MRARLDGDACWRRGARRSADGASGKRAQGSPGKEDDPEADSDKEVEQASGEAFGPPFAAREEVGTVRTAGFPCRPAGCRRTFAVADQSSMEALMIASAARSAHEIADHGYQHVPMNEEPVRSPYAMARPMPHPRGANGRC